MAGIAALADNVGPGVIDDRGQEGERVVAGAAIAGYRDMVDGQAESVTGHVITVVAGHAIAGNSAVVEYVVGEGRRRMTDITIQ